MFSRHLQIGSDAIVEARYYNKCPFCGGSVATFWARPLPMRIDAGDDDLLPEYKEEAVCKSCSRRWEQKRKGCYGELIREVK